MPVTPAQVIVKLDLEISLRSKIAMAALGRKNVIAAAVPVKAAFTKPSPSCNHRLVTGNAAANGDNVVERDYVFGRKGPNSPTGGLKIVDEDSFGKFQFVGQPPSFDNPRQI